MAANVPNLGSLVRQYGSIFVQSSLGDEPLSAPSETVRGPDSRVAAITTARVLSSSRFDPPRGPGRHGATPTRHGRSPGGRRHGVGCPPPGWRNEFGRRPTRSGLRRGTARRHLGGPKLTCPLGGRDGRRWSLRARSWRVVVQAPVGRVRDGWGQSGAPLDREGRPRRSCGGRPVSRRWRPGRSRPSAPRSLPRGGAATPGPRRSRTRGGPSSGRRPSARASGRRAGRRRRRCRRGPR